MSLVTDVDDEARDAGGPRLDVPEEPEELRIALRDELLAGGDWRTGFSDDICIGVWLWARWQPALEPAGCSREDFVDHRDVDAPRAVAVAARRPAVGAVRGRPGRSGGAPPPGRRHVVTGRPPVAAVSSRRNRCPM